MADQVTFRFTGFGDYMLSLREWHARLRSAVQDEALLTGGAMVDSLRAQYPKVTGNLASKTRVVNLSDGNMVKVLVKAAASHTHLYEYGTRERTGYTPRRVFLPGVGFRMVSRFGRMPAKPTFIPTAVKYRQAMNGRIRLILASAEPALGSGSPDVTET